MKKIMFIAALGFFSLYANAQTKEELKAQKEAQKEAEKQVKKAKDAYEMSIPNPQYGRKETDFARLDNAKALVKEALANPVNKDNAQVYSVAADIIKEYYQKIDNQVKGGDESVKDQLLDYAYDLAEYSMKFDSLEVLNPKKKENEYKMAHLKYQQYATNALILCLQAAQNYSNSDNKADLPKGYKLADLVVRGMGKSHLMSDFTHDEKENWITFAKAFKAQSIMGMEGASPAQVEAAYSELIGTKHEITAYSALANYFHEKDGKKYMEYLRKGMDKAEPETFPGFAFQLLQYQFNKEELKDEALKTIQDIKAKCPDNENTLNAYLMEGQIYFERKQFDKAEALFADAVSKYPDDDRAIAMPARCAWMKAQNSSDKKDIQHAIDLFKKLEASHPSKSDLWGEPLYILYNNVGNMQARDKYKKYYKM